MFGGYLIDSVGGGLRGALRHGVNRFALSHLSSDFPYGTLIVNVAGCLLMGVVAELFLVKGGGSQDFRLFLTTGILGGFTTFSALSLEAALMWQRGDYVALGSYIVSSVLLSIVALFTAWLPFALWPDDLGATSLQINQSVDRSDCCALRVRASGPF